MPTPEFWEYVNNLYLLRLTRPKSWTWIRLSIYNENENFQGRKRTYVLYCLDYMDGGIVVHSRRVGHNDESQAGKKILRVINELGPIERCFYTFIRPEDL